MLDGRAGARAPSDILCRWVGMHQLHLALPSPRFRAQANCCRLTGAPQPCGFKADPPVARLYASLFFAQYSSVRPLALARLNASRSALTGSKRALHACVHGCESVGVRACARVCVCLCPSQVRGSPAQQRQQPAMGAAAAAVADQTRG